MTFLFVSMFPVVQQLQGIKYPFLFKWMNENMSEWRKTRRGGWGVAGPEKGDRGHPCVCQYAVWTLVTRKSPWRKKKDQWDKLTLGRNWLVLLFGERPDGGKGMKQHTGPNPSYSYSPVHRLRGSTCKKKNKTKKTSKCTKMDWNSIILWFTRG